MVLEQAFEKMEFLAQPLQARENQRFRQARPTRQSAHGGARPSIPPRRDASQTGFGAVVKGSFLIRPEWFFGLSQVNEGHCCSGDLGENPVPFLDTLILNQNGTYGAG